VSLVGLGLILDSCGNAPSLGPASIIYAAHSQSHSLSVINLPTGKTVASIEIGNSSVGYGTVTPSYPTGVAVTPDGSRAYVTDAFTSVWVVDTVSDSVIAKIAAGSTPEAIAITPDGKSAYVASNICGGPSCPEPDDPPQLAAVEVIDTASNSLKATITIGNNPVEQTPGVLLSGIALSPDGTRAYVSNGQGNQVWAIDTASNQIVDMIPTAVLGFVGVSISPDGSRLYAASVGNPSVVYVIDTTIDAVVTSISLPSSEAPTQISVTPDGSHAYVTGDIGHVWVIDTATNGVVATISVSFDNWLHDIAFAPDGSRAYVTCGNTNTIYVLDTATHRVVGQIPSSYPGGLAIASST
jgi:YVTN family beta-propeller protein